MINSILNSVNKIQILQLGFWFHSDSRSLTEASVTLGIFSLLVVIGIFLLLYNRRRIGNYPPKNNLIKPAGIGIIVFGVAGLVFSLFNWQGIAFLGVRLTLLVIFVTSLGWGSYFLYLYQTKLRQETIRYEARIIKRRYFTKEKR